MFSLRCNNCDNDWCFFLFVFVCTANGRGRREEKTAAGTQQNCSNQVPSEKTRKDYESDASEYLFLVTSLYCVFNIIIVIISIQ